MTIKTLTSCVITFTCAVLMTASCSEEVVYRRPVPGPGHGPLAHAPAHGLRRKYVQGVELVFDAERGVYVVVGCVDHYYSDGYFFRFYGGVWEVSLYHDRDWGPLGHKPLPPGLHARSNGKIKIHGNPGNQGKGKNKKAS
jgi:hypothetical protein